MQSLKTQGASLFTQGSGPDPRSSGPVIPATDSSEAAGSSRPFIERRRPAPIQTPWPEALDSLQRYLLSYETAYKQMAEYRAIFEEAPIGIFQVSPEGHPLRLNSQMARIFGYDSADQYLAALAEDASLRFFDPTQWNESDPSVVGGIAGNGIDLQIRCRDGVVKWVRFNLRAVREGGTLVRFDGTAEDVTVKKREEIRTELLAYYDLVTGLPNRTFFHDRFNEVISSLSRTGGQAALLLLEFDQFKAFNDSLGEFFGDRLLQEIAGRIRLAAGESSIVARLGGAEFGVLIRLGHPSGDVVSAAERILAKLDAEYSLLGHALSVFCSMGISVFPKHGVDYETLLKKADVAKGCARDDGANNFRFFTDEMKDEIQQCLTMESGLRLALAKKELYLEYQPQVDIRTGAVAGVEALLRWNSSELGLVPPNRFIGIAESSSLIVPIGEWVLRAACAQARAWQDRGLPAVPVAVNVSPVQFRQRGFCELVRSTLRDTGLEPEYLELEVTEGLLMSNADLMASIMAELRTLGVTLAIDDFGTGYSSLGYLSQFKVHRLKIDRSFVKDVPSDPDDAAITIAIIKMAKAMNLAVLAEGVETKEQVMFLQAQDCQTMQGFYFSKPVAVDEVDGHLRTGFSRLLPAASA